MLRDETLVQIVAHCRALVTLDVSYNSTLTDAAVLGACAQLSAGKGSRALVDLNLSHLPLLTDASLAAVAQEWGSRLRRLWVTHNARFSSIGVAEIALHCEGLLSLDFTDCTGVDFLGVVVRSSNGVQTQFVSRDFTHLSLSGCTGLLRGPLMDSGTGAQVSRVHLTFAWLVSACGLLTSLELRGLGMLNDDIIKGVIFGAPHLGSLDLANCPGVGPESVMLIGTTRMRLRQLSLRAVGLTKGAQLLVPQEKETAYKGETDAAVAVRALLTGTAPTLQVLDIAQNRGVSDFAMDLPHALPQLRSVDVSGCSLGGLGVACLAERATGLLHLSVADNALVNDAALCVVAECCPRLLLLDVSKCPQLTDFSLMRVVESCVALQVLKANSATLQTDSKGGRWQQFTDALLEACLRAAALRHLELRNQCGIELQSPWLQQFTYVAETDVGKTPAFCNGTLQIADLQGWEGVQPRALCNLLASIQVKSSTARFFLHCRKPLGSLFFYHSPCTSITLNPPPHLVPCSSWLLPPSALVCYLQMPSSSFHSVW
jgi:hypothetical protein